MKKEEDCVTLNFRIEYDTKGNELGIIGSLNEFGNWEEGKYHKLTWGTGNIWRTTIKLPFKNNFELRYKYVELESGKILRNEDKDHLLKIDTSFKNHNLLLIDRWLERNPIDIVNESSAFKVIRNRPNKNKTKNILSTPSQDKISFTLKMRHHNLKENETLYLSGSQHILGNWDLNDALQMNDHAFPDLETTITIPKDEGFIIEYKFVKGPINNLKTENAIWETSANRRLVIDKEISSFTHVIVDCPPFIGDKNWRGVGVAIPVFSLRSEESLGVGEFSDLKLLVDFAKRVGIKLVQILPVNDTNITGTWIDSSPYSGLSVFALHPIYLRIQSINGVPRQIIKRVNELKSNMDDKFVDYEETLKTKLDLLSEIFKKQKVSFKKDKNFIEWFSQNKEWLVPYAVFCSLRDKNKTCDFNKWGEYSNISNEQILELSNEKSEIYDGVVFNYFIQYHASKQLREASEYASSHGIALKGDLPVGVALHSCDVWLNRHLFKMDFNVGTPPEDFEYDGENWGFPMYDWDEMAKDDYKWWRNRLKVLSNYFHAFRIDHILGFFRIWEIPRTSKSPYLGKFNPAYPISASEFEEKGIWDFKRLTEPYVSWEELKSNFNESKSHLIVKEYLDEVQFSRYTVKSKFDTEKKLVETMNENDEDNETKNFLLKVFHDRVLIEDPQNSRHFHFRIQMQKTISFKDLDAGWKNSLEELYKNYFDYRQNSIWRECALEKLPMMQDTTDMLVCGEDVGVVPKCTQSVLDDLSILGLRIQRKPKDETLKLENLDEIPYLSVCSPSVHDTSTLRGFWEEDRCRAKMLGEMIGLDGNLPIECPPDIIEKIIGLHFASVSILVVVPIQDFLSLDYNLRIDNPEEERVNFPSNRHHYWRYRIPVTLEKLLSCEEWLERISTLIKNTGRDS